MKKSEVQFDEALDTVTTLLEDKEEWAIVDRFETETFDTIVRRLASNTNDLDLLRLVAGVGMQNLWPTLVEILPPKRLDALADLALEEMKGEHRQQLDPELLLAGFGFAHPETLTNARIRRWYKYEDYKVFKEAIVPYWRHRIATDIAKSDWVRAWDDLRHAFNGLFGGDAEALLRFYENVLPWGFNSATYLQHHIFYVRHQSERRQLVETVFNAMREKNVIPALADDWLVTYDTHPKCPGRLEVRFFIEDSNRREIVVSQHGEMLLAIAQYAAERIAAKRRKRMEKRTTDVKKDMGQ